MYKILLAEDNSKLRLLMERYLRTHGFDVRCAADGAEAIDLFHSEPFDLILLDILMPEKTGSTSAITFVKLRKIQFCF